MGDELPPASAACAGPRAPSLLIDLLYDDSWEEKLTQKPPQIVVPTASPAK